MKSFSRFSCCLSLSLAMVFFATGCSDDDPSDGGPVDTTPPAVANVAALDGQHVEVVFDEDVSRTSAEEPSNYAIVEHGLYAAPSPTARNDHGGEPGLSPAQTEIVSAALVAGQTVMLSLSGFMQNVTYDILVQRVSDVHGNLMTGVSTTQFQGSDALDNTPPSIVSVSPAPNSSGAGKSQPIIVVFSEPMQDPSVFSAFLLTGSKGKVAVAMQKWEQNEYIFSPVIPMDGNTLHTAVLSSSAADYSDNPLSPTSWTFRTTASTETYVPSLISTIPVDGSTNVPTDGFIELDFSEAIDPTSLERVLITPVPGEGIEEWLNDGRTVRFTPHDPLLTDTQYFMVLSKGSFRDLAGNLSAETYTIQFSTGSSLANGRIQGTLTGDPFSVQADDPTGAIVVATTIEIFDDGDDFDIYGIGVAAANGDYSVERLPDKAYYPFAVLDSNGDGVIDPEMGDAFGAYGVNARNNDFTQNSVFITDGSTVTQVDFPLFDGVTIAGHVFYDGDAYISGLAWHKYWVGAFDAATFDPENPGVPVAGTEDGPLAWDAKYVMNQLDSGLEPGTYYVGCYLDVTSNGVFDPGVDPSGYYANLETGDPQLITVENGTDALEINIHIDDPQGSLAGASAVTWGSPLPKNGQNAVVRRAFERLRTALRTVN